MPQTRPILALCTERTGPRFVEQACGAEGADRMVIPSDLDMAAVRGLAADVAAWADAHVEGRVVSLGDGPSVVHALAHATHPGVAPLRGATLDPTLAALDKAYCREHVVGDLGALPTGVLEAGDARVPLLSAEDDGGMPVLVKPVGGCASMGIVKTVSGAEAPDVPVPDDPFTWLRRQRLPTDGDDARVAVVETYVPPEVPRVSVDGWVDTHGEPIPFAVSDNRYVDGEPERFCHQVFPSRLSPAAEEACWALYGAVVRRLAERHGLRDQFCDVEMFVFDHDTNAPRAEVMEVNCRVHPNIAPILRRCLTGGDVFAAHIAEPLARPAPTGLTGTLFYVWSETPGEAGRPDPEAVAALQSRDDVIPCLFDTPGPVSHGHTCWGWLYVFGEDREATLAEGRRLREGLGR